MYRNPKQVNAGTTFYAKICLGAFSHQPTFSESRPFFMHAKANYCLYNLCSHMKHEQWVKRCSLGVAFFGRTLITEHLLTLQKTYLYEGVCAQSAEKCALSLWRSERSVCRGVCVRSVCRGVCVRSVCRGVSAQSVEECALILWRTECALNLSNVFDCIFYAF